MSTVDPITESISASRIKSFWSFDCGLSYGDLAKKAISKIPLEMKQQMSSLIYCTLSNDEAARHQIYKDIDAGKSRSRPSVVLEAAGFNTRIGLCEGLEDVNPDIYNIQAACATGLKALEIGYMTVTLRDEVVVIGACDKMINDYNFTFFNSLGAVSKEEEFYGPFDKRRNGFAMGTGAAFMVLCSEERANAMGWTPIASVDSVRSLTKPVHPTNPSDIDFISQLVKKSLADSNTNVKDIAHWNAHATCTPMGDELEYAAFLNVVGNYDIPISSLKGRIGHTMAPSSLIELIHGIQSVKEGTVFANSRLEQPLEQDPRILIDQVSTDKKTILKTSFGFGGRNSVAVVTVI